MCMCLQCDSHSANYLSSRVRSNLVEKKVDQFRIRDRSSHLGSDSESGRTAIRFPNDTRHDLSRAGLCGVPVFRLSRIVKKKLPAGAGRLCRQGLEMTSKTSEILMGDSVWWIVGRGTTWGPFDRRGIEFTYQGNKFGEIYSEDEFSPTSLRIVCQSLFAASPLSSPDQRRRRFPAGTDAMRVFPGCWDCFRCLATDGLLSEAAKTFGTLRSLTTGKLISRQSVEPPPKSIVALTQASVR